MLLEYCRLNHLNQNHDTLDKRQSNLSDSENPHRLMVQGQDQIPCLVIFCQALGIPFKISSHQILSLIAKSLQQSYDRIGHSAQP